MRVVLRVLAPLLGLAVAAAGVLLVLEVVADWIRPGAARRGLVVPWPNWYADLGRVSWSDTTVTALETGVAVAGLLLTCVGLLARRADVRLDGPTPAVTVTTSPRVLARLVGRRVRAADGVAGASVTASRHRIAVTAQGWDATGPDTDLRDTVQTQVDALLDELPLPRRPRVAVTVQEPKGPR